MPERSRVLHKPLCIVRFRERRGSQGWSCTPGWPGPATGRHHSWLEETSFRTALTASATALLSVFETSIGAGPPLHVCASWSLSLARFGRYQLGAACAPVGRLFSHPRAMAFRLDEYPAVALLMCTGQDGSFGVLGHGYLSSSMSVRAVQRGRPDAGSCLLRPVRALVTGLIRESAR